MTKKGYYQKEVSEKVCEHGRLNAECKALLTGNMSGLDASFA
jgi:hypothetical protein